MKQNITQLFSCDKNLLSWGPMTRGGGSIRAGRPPGTCRGCRHGRGRWTPPCPADLSAGQASPTAPAPQPCDPRLRYNSITVHMAAPKAPAPQPCDPHLRYNSITVHMDRANSAHTTAVWPAPDNNNRNSTGNTYIPVLYWPRQQHPHHSCVTRTCQQQQ